MSAEERAQVVRLLLERGIAEEDIEAALAQLARLAAAHDEQRAAGDVPPPEPLLDAFEGLEGVAAVAKGITEGRFKKIVVMVGAGISVAAGIPDFRTPGTGLYDNLQKYDLPDPQSIFEINYFQQQPKAFYHLAKELFPGTFAPTPTHYLLRLLHEKGVLLRVFSQNIDSLETLAGLPKDKMVAAHGNFDSAHCIATGAEVPVQEVREAILAGEEGWRAMRERHGGLVKPDIVFFGERLPPRFQQCMMTDLPQCDLLIVMGTSLKVQPFASLVGQVGSDIPRLLINREKVGEQMGGIMGMLTGDTEGFDFSENNYRDAYFLGDCDAGSRALARACGWADELEQACVSAYDTLISQGTVSLPICHAHRGASHALLDDEDAAERDFRKALELDPHLSVAAEQLLALVGVERAGLATAAASADPTAYLDTDQTRQLEEHLAAVRIQRVMRKRGGAKRPEGIEAAVPEPEPELEPQGMLIAPPPIKAPPAIVDARSHVSGLWQGERMTASDVGHTDQLEWALSLTKPGPDVNSPTAFGAMIVDGKPYTLRGGWTVSTSKVELMAVPENFAEGDDLHYEYEATLSAGVAGTWTLEGRWRAVTGAEVAAAVAAAEAAAQAATAADGNASAPLEFDSPWLGNFSCTRSDQTGANDTIVGMGGLFLGEAVPAAHLVATVPRNPIKWVLAATKSDGDTHHLIGAGFFDDAGDFPGAPVLYFFLRGTLAADMSFELEKVYERKTGGLSVQYKGVVASVVDGGDATLAELRGQWANESQGSAGLFGARQEAAQGTMPAPAC